MKEGGAGAGELEVAGEKRELDNHHGEARASGGDG